MPVRTASAIPATRPKEALALVTEMMAIPGKSCEEGRIVEFIKKKLRQAGIPAALIKTDTANKRSPRGGEVGNLIVKLPGTIKAPRRLLMAHVDTVPLCVGCKPVKKGSKIVSADKHTALGADDRAGATVLLNTLIEIKRQKLAHPPLTFFWPVQEEIGLVGARHASLNLLGGPKLCFNWDGGSASMACIGATGAYDLVIEVSGIASHAGVRPEAGASAIAITSRAVAELADHGWHGLIVKGSHTGTSNFGFVHGGEATNVVTPSVTIHAETRSHDPAFRKRIVEEFRAAFDRAVKATPNSEGRTGSFKFESELKYESFRLDDEEPTVLAANRAIAAVGRTPVPHVTNGGLDGNWLTKHGLPTVTLGCGQENVHTVNEALDIAEFQDACRIGLCLATRSA